MNCMVEHHGLVRKELLEPCAGGIIYEAGPRGLYIECVGYLL